MFLRRLELVQFRTYPQLTLELPDGLTAVVGPNGVGKTNLVEAVAWPLLLTSVRGVANEALVRQGASAAVVRAELEASAVEGEPDPTAGGDGASLPRQVLIESEISARGRTRVLLNRQAGARRRDVAEVGRVTVFSPDDLVLVKGSPVERRRFLDDALVAADPRLDVVRADYEKVVRQRNALLRQAHGRLDDAGRLTLEVWDAQLIDRGERLGRARSSLVKRLGPLVEAAYRELAGRDDEVAVTYQAPWLDAGLGALVAGRRAEELRRGVTLVGPHRDELALGLHGLVARTQASQGEQRSLALSLRLAVHRLLTERFGAPPILVLDDVLSELDPQRRRALIGGVPAGQALLTTAGDLPEEVEPAAVLEVNRPGEVSWRAA
ncbi:MAG: DNA replication/repair protein RecF [Microthrixaceae bacterium]